MNSSAIIVGGGITGLSAAWELARAGQDFVLLESAPRVGSVIQTVRRDGFVAERGPDSFLGNKPPMAALCEELGLADEVVASLPAPRPQLAGRLPALPAALPEDETLAAYLLRCFGEARGAELASTVVGPMLAGVYGGRIEEWSAQSWLAARATAGSAPARFNSLRCGMQQLIEALVDQLPGDRLRTGAALDAAEIARVIQSGERRVILALPAWRAAELLAFDADLAGPLSAIPYVSSRNVNLAYRRSPPLPPGHGMLAGPEQAPLLAATYAHQKFPGRAPAGGALVRLFYPDGAEPDWLALGLPDPDWMVSTHCDRAMPQYTTGHPARLAAIGAGLARYPNLRLCGNAYGGVGMPDCIASGRAAAGA